jgi:outer membrane murein-binding lipoprotein Lpp
MLSPSYSHAIGEGDTEGPMKRFLMLLGVAVVAGAMYVAAAPGSQRATGPTAKQFNTLKKQVASLNKSLKALKKDEAQVKGAAVAAVQYIGACFLDSNGNIENLQVNEFGTTAAGFYFGAAGGAGTATATRSALDVDASGSPLAYLQEVTPGCVTGAAGAAHQSGIARAQLWAEHAR